MWLKRLLCYLLFTTIAATPTGMAQESKTSNHTIQILDDTPWRTTYSKPYTSDIDDEPADLSTLQCPIPMECRVPNHTGIQCVFSSIEMLGRWAEEPKLIDPPITSRSNCKSYSGPSDASRKLTAFNVKFEQVYGDRKAAITLIKKAVGEGRGCLFDVPGHAMVLVHYDEKEDRVCWVDNSDRSLKVQTTTVEKFKQRWGGWVLVIYADNDIIPFKLNPYYKIPVFDDMNRPVPIPDGYLPIP